MTDPVNEPVVPATDPTPVSVMGTPPATPPVVDEQNPIVDPAPVTVPDSIDGYEVNIEGFNYDEFKAIPENQEFLERARTAGLDSKSLGFLLGEYNQLIPSLMEGNAALNNEACVLAFDFNMRPQLTYVTNEKTYLRWYDTTVSKYVTTEFGADYISPQLSLDDHRLHQSANADIIFAYVRNAKLCYRQQRDRYQIEHVLSDAKNQKLTQIGMSKNYRFQFRLVFDWRDE